MFNKKDKQPSLEETLSITMELEKPLEEDRLESTKEYKIKVEKKKKKNKLLRNIILTILTITVIGFIMFISNEYSPQQNALNALESDSKVNVVIDDNIKFTPVNVETTKGFILYPGALVESESYSPFAREIAEKGYEVIVVDTLLNLPILSSNKGEKIIEENPHITDWVIGGHSLGGIVASNIAGDSTAIDGVVLLASYPMNEKLKEINMNTISIWGSKDGVINFDNLIESKEKLPQDTNYVEIEGGNHAQFGDYGHQKGDNEALIDAQTQLSITTSNVLTFLENIYN